MAGSAPAVGAAAAEEIKWLKSVTDDELRAVTPRREGPGRTTRVPQTRQVPPGHGRLARGEQTRREQARTGPPPTKEEETQEVTPALARSPSVHPKSVTIRGLATFRALLGPSVFEAGAPRKLTAICDVEWHGHLAREEDGRRTLFS